MKSKKRLIIIHPFRLPENDFKRLELDCLEKHYELEIHDVLKINLKGKIQKYYKEPKIKNTIIFENSDSWKRYMKDLKKEKKENIFVMYVAIHYNFFFFETLRFCKKNDIKTIRFKTNPLPSTKKNNINPILLLFEKVINFFLKPSFFLKMTLPTFFYTKIINFFYLETNYIFVGGQKKYDQFKKKENTRTKVVKFNSWDYSYYIRKKDKFLNEKKYAVFIDDGSPGNFNDFSIYSKSPETVDKYYPLLNKFFSRLEKIFKVEIIIASHPKSYNDKKYFQNRKTISFKTNELVDNSEFVITKYSSGLSFAVLSKKPILFFYTNEHNKFRRWLKMTIDIANQLGTKAFNIENECSEEFLKSLMNVNSEAYNKSIMSDMASIKEKSNYKIIQENI